MAYHVINTKPNNNNNNSNNNSNNNNNTTPTTPSVNQPPVNNTPDTNEVPDLLIDYYQLASDQKLQPVLFRQNVTKRLLTTLTTHNHPNALLIGEAGTGKTAIVEDLAYQLFHHDPVIEQMLGNETRIYELPLNNLVAGSSMFGALEQKLKEVINFIKDPNNHAILYLDEIHQLMTNQSLKNVAEILKPVLSRGEMHVIGSTTTQELKFWQKNPAMNRRFSNIIVPEVSDDQTITILEKVLPNLQIKTNPVQVDASLFSQIVQTANQYAQSLNTHRPDSAITLLDQAISMARLQSIELMQSTNTKLAPKVTRKLIEKAGLQLVNQNDQNFNQKTVTKLTDQLEQNIIGQTKAKEAVIKAVQSMALDLLPAKKPHSFLFAGLTGTGKTEMAKQLSDVIFNAKDRLLYINMTEYAHGSSLTQLIGSSRGYVGSESAQPLPLDVLKSNPFQIVVLDEFEKADQRVQKLFMQALDEGQIHYADGSLVDFSHAIVIATTNAGTEKLSTPNVGFNQSKQISEKDLMTNLSKSFAPELLNRFEYLVNFNRITKDQYAQVLAIKYNQTIKDIQHHRNDLTFEPESAKATDQFIQTLSDETYNQLKNARPAQRSIQHLIEQAMIDNPNQSTYTFEV